MKRDEMHAAMKRHAESLAAITDEEWRERFRERISSGMEDKTNLAYWFPKIRDAGLPVPRTEIIQVDDPDGELFCIEEKESSVFDRLCEQILDVAREKFTPPVFLRTGHTSGKHRWKDCCYLDTLDLPVIKRHVWNLIEFSQLVDILGLPMHTWVIREMLPVRPLFRLHAYGGMPFVPEMRLFVEDGTCKYMVPYWPDGAIEEGEPDSADWRKLVSDAECYMDLRLSENMKRLAEIAGAAVGGRWSVDILVCPGDVLYVTDMAEAERSYGFDEDRFE